MSFNILDLIRQKIREGLRKFHLRSGRELENETRINISVGYDLLNWPDLSDERKAYYERNEVLHHMGLVDEVMDKKGDEEHMIDDIHITRQELELANGNIMQTKMRIAGAHNKNYAKVHEYGEGNMPERSFARPALKKITETALPDIIRFIKTEVEKIPGVTAHVR